MKQRVSNQTKIEPIPEREKQRWDKEQSAMVSGALREQAKSVVNAMIRGANSQSGLDKENS